MAPALALKYVAMDERLSADEGLSCPHDLSTWGPSSHLLPQDGWYTLGHTPTSSYHTGPPGVIVYALDPTALGEIASWVKVWDDKGSGATGDYSLWRGIAENPEEYAVIGGIFSRNHYYTPPLRKRRG